MTPNDIQNKKFDRAVGGYKPEDVNIHLNQVADYVQQLEAEKKDLEDKMMILAEKLEEYREDEDSLRAALIGAQKLGDSVVRDAKTKAEVLITEAKMKAQELVNDAQSNIDKETVALSQIKNEVADFRNQILAMYKRHIEMIQSIPNEEEASNHNKYSHHKKSISAPASTESADSELTFSFSGQQDEEEPVEEPLLTFEEDTKDVAEQMEEQKPKRSNYGNLRFGEDYNLTRKD